MSRKDHRTLEFNKIVEMLSKEASCEPGRYLCERIHPLNEKERIIKLQDETESAFDRIVKYGDISFAGVISLNEQMKRLEAGGVLSMDELLSVANVLDRAKQARDYDDKMEENTDALSETFKAIEPHVRVAKEIRRCIVSKDTVADDASSELSGIRRAMSSTNNKIKGVLQKMLNGSTRSYLQDPIITLRSGRYCLPVMAEYKKEVPGMIHDQSATGATLFIEPMQVVSLNNDIRELQLKEEKEIEKILYALSEMVAEVADEISYSQRLISELDFAFAKARLAGKMRAMKPEFNEEGIIRLRGARHPLLDKDTVVPIDIEIGDTFSQLLVTGPNTGGKTVSLKTCGLLVLMAHAGLHIPAKDRSTMPIFKEVCADIGDEQSIEQSLSTFSSHMTNLIRIFDRVRAGEGRYLVLLDELCSGTDPDEGAALAMSILEHLHYLGVHTMATTHYSQLKVYALSTEGVENASCEFSLETMTPTYRFLIGVPGKSNAFAISGKLGLDNKIIEDAKAHIEEKNQSFEEAIVELEMKRAALDRDILAMKEDKAKIDERLEEVTKKQEKLDSQRDKILQSAREEASDILQEAKKVADETIRDFHKYAAGNPNISEMEKKRQAVGKKLSDSRAAGAAKTKAKARDESEIPRNLKVGDDVYVISMDVNGIVLSKPKENGDVQVQMGILKSMVNIRDLAVIKEEKPKNKKKTNQYYGGFSKAATFSPEIKLLGLTVDEAISKLDKYLDDAIVTHLDSVRVVHGKGTGALRKGIHQYLRKHPAVKEFSLAEFGEGDSGVTIVKL